MGPKRNEQAVTRAKELFPQTHNDREISLILRRERLLQPNGRAYSTAWVTWCRKGFPRVATNPKQPELPLTSQHVERLFGEVVVRSGSVTKARKVFEACANLCR